MKTAPVLFTVTAGICVTARQWGKGVGGGSGPVKRKVLNDKWDPAGDECQN